MADTKKAPKPRALTSSQPTAASVLQGRLDAFMAMSWDSVPRTNLQAPHEQGFSTTTIQQQQYRTPDLLLWPYPPASTHMVGSPHQTRVLQAGANLLDLT